MIIYTRRLRQKRDCYAHARLVFQEVVMVSVGVSKLGQTQLIFVDPAVKINGAYYRDVLLTQQLLATAFRAGDLRRLLHLAARQCSSAPRTRHNQTS